MAIQIYIREHQLHNMGYSDDIRFDLDHYTDVNDVIDEAREELGDKLEEHNPGLLADCGGRERLFEEWLITDIEIENEWINYNDIGFDEYMNIDKLIEINEMLENEERSGLYFKCYRDLGYSIEESIEKAAQGDLEIHEVDYYGDNVDSSFGNYLTTYPGDFGLEIPDHLISYIDDERLGRDYMMDYSYIDTDGGYIVFREY